VSGVGDDANPCSRTAPCRTFAGAIAKTEAGGEISVLDPGGYGAVTITKALTINGEGTLASVLAGSGVGIVVNAAATDKVVLRNLSISGSGGGTVGVEILGGTVVIDKCLISGFVSGFIGGIGMFMNASANAYLSITDTNLVGNSHGVWMSTSAGFGVAALDNVRITDTPGYGIIMNSNSTHLTLNRSYIYNTGTAAIITNTGNGVVNVNDSVLTNNIVAVSAQAQGSTIRLNNVSLYDNSAAIQVGAGTTLATAGNNKAVGNGGALSTNGTVTNF
jgi:hypothetical protein